MAAEQDTHFQSLTLHTLCIYMVVYEGWRHKSHRCWILFHQQHHAVSSHVFSLSTTPETCLHQLHTHTHTAPSGTGNTSRHQKFLYPLVFMGCASVQNPQKGGTVPPTINNSTTLIAVGFEHFICQPRSTPELAQGAFRFIDWYWAMIHGPVKNF